MTNKEMRAKLRRLEKLWDGARMISDHAQVAELSAAIRRIERKLDGAKGNGKRRK